MRVKTAPPLEKLGWKRHAAILGYALLIVIVSRLLLYGIGYLGMNLFPVYTMEPSYKTFDLGDGQVLRVMDLPESLSDTQVLKPSHVYKFDVFSYMSIARDGYNTYQINEPHPPANWVFFPLYPLMVKGLSYLLPWSLHTIGLVLSNALLVFALYFIHLTALARGVAKEGIGFILCTVVVYPASIYFSLMYTESLFLCLCAATLYFAHTKRFFWAMLAAGLSTVTRVPGIANLVFAGGAILVELIRRRKLVWADARFLGYAVLSVLPMLSYLAYMKHLTGDFLAPMHEQDNWGRATAFPFGNYFHYLSKPYFILGGGGWDNGAISFTMATFALLVFFLYAVKHWRKLFGNLLELLFFIYGFFLIAIPFSSSPDLLTSIVRYMMVSIPMYFYLHDLTARYPLLRHAAVTLLIMLNTVITICFVNEYFFVV